MQIEGHTAVIRFDPERDQFRGEFSGLNGGADFYANSVEALRKGGAASLKTFLAVCEERGIEPYPAGVKNMTTMLEKAFTEASRLSDIEQNALARWLLEEIESERKWDNLFAESEDELGRLALEALSEHEKGKTTSLDPDKL